jgi:hypothetical protein
VHGRTASAAPSRNLGGVDRIVDWFFPVHFGYLRGGRVDSRNFYVGKQCTCLVGRSIVRPLR